MTNFEKRRKRVGLTSSEMADLMQVDYKIYKSWDKGEIKMPSKYIDVFNKIINRGKNELKVDSLTRKEVVENWWNEITEDRAKFKAKMKDFNISNYDELGRLIGYSNGTTICSYINKNRECGFEVKSKLYSFFANELNIQPPKSKGKRKSKSTYNSNVYTKIYNKLVDIDKNIELIQSEINKLEEKKQQLQNCQHIYNELLEEIKL